MRSSKLSISARSGSLGLVFGPTERLHQDLKIFSRTPCPYLSILTEVEVTLNPLRPAQAAGAVGDLVYGVDAAAVAERLAARDVRAAPYWAGRKGFKVTSTWVKIKRYGHGVQEIPISRR